MYIYVFYIYIYIYIYMYVSVYAYAAHHHIPQLLRQVVHLKCKTNDMRETIGDY